MTSLEDLDKNWKDIRSRWLAARRAVEEVNSMSDRLEEMTSDEIERHLALLLVGLPYGNSWVDQLLNATKIYNIARDQGLPQAMLWKLQHDRA